MYCNGSHDGVNSARAKRSSRLPAFGAVRDSNAPARGRPMGSPVKGTPQDSRPLGGPGAAPLLRSAHWHYRRSDHEL